MTAKLRLAIALLRAGAVIIMVALFVAYLLDRTDPAGKRINEPYAILEISPNGLQETWISEGPHRGGRWVLAYTTIVRDKREACEEILIRRRLEKLGETKPVAENSVPSRSLVPVTDAPMIATGQAVLLPAMLQPGDYILSVEITCFQRDQSNGILIPLSPTAKTPPFCFQVPGHDPEPNLRGPIDMLPQRCADQLSKVHVKVGSSSMR